MTKQRCSVIKWAVFFSAFQLATTFVGAQKVYFVDGYHGGVYGHYPKQYTRFITDALDKNPDWKINLELEPETWDSVQLNEPENYEAFKKDFADQSFNSRMEYVNPSYGQGYLYNINGESIIRQFYYGIKKLKSHFPTAVFTTYSSEEPCFTSALPQLLASYGFSYASLKNPNTCWGGYTRAFGGELVNWIGPDGTKILTVPRYGIEALDKNSTWQTIASVNSDYFLQTAFKNGIANPVGMCLQDAGWKNGPWLGKKTPTYPTEYVTWRNYIKNIAIKKTTQDWHFSQEDVQVSLVWGAQVLQQIAKQIRVSENKLDKAEKLNAMANIYKKMPWPTTDFDEAWRGLLLSQHHDCWIVPYNGRTGNTWIDKVATWTANADKIADNAITQSTQALSAGTPTGNYSIRVFNTTAGERKEVVKVILPTGFNVANFVVVDKNQHEMPSQILTHGNGTHELVFEANVPAIGFNTYQLKNKKTAAQKSGHVQLQANGMYAIETDFYKIMIDPAKGGIIKSIVAKKLDNKEFVDASNARGFNELRGYFFNDSAYFSSTQNPATITVLEDGAQMSKLEIKGSINHQPFTQTLTVYQNQPLIDLNVKIDWIGNPGIGDGFKQKGGMRSEDYRKAFYNDSDKLQTLFPLNLTHQKVYKNAPFDVTESRLGNTFFQTWDSIKNNILLNWVDVTDGAANYGLALFTDHTTNYSHGEDYPLALTTQYSGLGLWGRNYSITGPTAIHYAILPHKNKWDKANIWTANTAWNNPMETVVFQTNKPFENPQKSLVSGLGKGVEITAILKDGNDLLVRFFNAEALVATQKITFDGTAKSIDLVELNGKIKQHLPTLKSSTGKASVILKLPKFGIRTIRLKDFKTELN